ncbi:uncharacterized protein METZ01_LOCUS45661, partial [marine metagenome]
VPRLVQVAVPVPLRNLLTYSVPDGLPMPPIGSRVSVPLGPRTMIGYVIQNNVPIQSDSDRAIKDILKQVDDQPFLPQAVIDLALWAADYYLCGPGQVLEVGLPQDRRVAPRTYRHFTLTAKGRSYACVDPGNRSPTTAKRLGPKQRLALDSLGKVGEGLSQSDLNGCGVSVSTLKRLVDMELVRVTNRQIAGGELNVDPVTSKTEFQLTPDQEAALARLLSILSTERFQTALLHGITGSGKTEIYLRLAKAVLRSGRRALILVPEIGLTSASAKAFRGLFGSRVAIQHSGLSARERHAQWSRIRAGDVDLVVGTRSAVFTPLDNIGLVVVDEEHDGSYKQEETPRYHGRDVAIMRAKQAGALVVLGSATPSLESYHRAIRGRYELIALTTRISDQGLPAIQIIDMKEEFAEQGGEVVLSRALASGIRDRLDRHEQVIILLNRRGFAASVFCRECGGTAECPNCSVSLTIHRTSGRVRCHYCGHSRLVPTRCPICQGEYLEFSGFGTERVELEVHQHFPKAKVARMDRDTMAHRGAADELLTRFGRGEIDILVGTQMVAKGHDFPKVTLVGVVSADVGLGVADFRAGERTFQLLTQVAGRAGRGARPGETIVQTINPTHYSIQHACLQSYEAFYREELQFRQAMRYPPTLGLINLIVRGSSESAAMRDGFQLVKALQHRGHAGWILGPAPAPLSRLKGQHRVQILAKGDHRTRLRKVVESALDQLPRIRRRISVDVDPVFVR